MSAPATIAVVDGEGVGPEIIEASLTVLDAVTSRTGSSIHIIRAEPLAERDDFGLVIGTAESKFYDDVFGRGIPVLHGPAGGRFVYQLREKFELNVKHTPIQVWPELANAAIVVPARSARADIVIVRDNSAGLYQGGYERVGDMATQTARYTASQVEAVIDSAIAVAAARSGRLTVVTKPGGIPTISRLWREIAEARVPAGVGLEFLEIDNACFQILANPTRFDVMVTSNMFGDVLGDTASALLGSRGMAYSANFGPGSRAVYQTAHGAAHDIAGTGTANPVAQMMSLAWLLRKSLGLTTEADLMVAAIRQELSRNVRTQDIANEDSMVVTTRQFTEHVINEIVSHG